MKTDEVIQTIKEDLLKLEWSSGAFYQAGFEYKVLSVEAGYPYFYVTNLPVTATNVENVSTDFTHTFEIGIVHQYPVVELSTSATEQKKKRKQKEEAYRRIRRAFDGLRNYAVKNSTLAKWFSSVDNYIFDFEFDENNVEDLNLLLYTMRFKVLEIVSKL